METNETNKTGKINKNEFLSCGLKIVSCIILIFSLSGFVSAYYGLGSICYCTSCSDCTNALNDNNCSVVKLNNSITNHSGTCINNPVTFNNKIFDCRGLTIDGDNISESWSDAGIYLYNKTNDTIRNCIITDFYYGIDLQHSSNNTLTNNTANNSFGIYLYFGVGIVLRDSSNNNTLTSNTANNNEYGILLDSSSNNILTNNTANNNYYYGVYLGSSNNRLTGNNLTGNDLYSLFDNGQDGCNHIDDLSNIGGDFGKPIRYKHDTTGITIQSTDAYSEILFCNVNNSVIDNVTISNPGTTSDGILLIHSNNNNITNSDLNYILIGILLDSSSNNILTNNTANNNEYFGVYLDNSSSNDITNNNITNNTRDGIYLYSNSNFNDISNNDISNNDNGIVLSDCEPWGNWCSIGNTNNILQENEISNNKVGIYSQNSNSTINSNFVCSNTQSDFNSGDWLLSSGDNNTCYKQDGWNDTGKTGCSSKCPEEPFNCDLNNDGIIIRDYNDLMTAYKCFLGIKENCNKIKYRDWSLIKQEYQCFIKNVI